MNANQTTSLIAIALLSGCAPQVDETLISYFDAPEQNMSEARRAVDLCLKTSGSWNLREQLFRQARYLDATFEDPERDIDKLRAVVLIQPETDVVVQLGADGGKSGCIVGLKGMTPQQSYELAQPLVAHFGAISNTALGQGLTPNAIEAWRASGTYAPIFIAAYKTWNVLEAPGAAVRLSH